MCTEKSVLVLILQHTFRLKRLQLVRMRTATAWKEMIVELRCAETRNINFCMIVKSAVN